MSTAAPRRSPKSGGYAPGEEARTRILKAALKVFAEEGYERTSTRRIAAEAGVKPPALLYYFDSKEGVHTACAKLMVDRTKSVLAGPMAKAEAALSANDPAACADALWLMLEALFGAHENDEEARAWRGFLARTRLEEKGPAYALAMSEINLPVYRRVHSLTAVSMGISSDDPLGKFTALALMNLLITVDISRPRTLALLGWEDLTETRRTIARDTLQEAFRRLLGLN